MDEINFFQRDNFCDQKDKLELGLRNCFIDGGQAEEGQKKLFEAGLAPGMQEPKL